MNRDVWVIDAVRTPIGRYGGTLAGVRPDDLAAIVLRAIVERTAISPSAIDDVYLGAANQSGEDNRNVARMASLLAGFPVEVPGATINRLCGSSLQAINSAAAAIACGEGDVMIAGGVESMTRAPYVLPKSDAAFGRKQQLFDTVLGWRMVNPAMPAEWTISLGETAEKVAERYGITRLEQDRFAVASQVKCKAATERGAFDAEIVPVAIRDARGSERSVARDEHPRPETTLDALAKLVPAFQSNGTVTAGNSSGINDGASALLLCEAEAARRFGLVPLARFVACASAGVAPDVMGLGPIPATRKALRVPASRWHTSTRSNSTKPSPRKRLPACANSSSIRSAPIPMAVRSRLGIRSVRAGSDRHHAAVRAAAAQGAVWFGDDVHRCRARDRNGIRARGVEGWNMTTAMTTTKTQLLIGSQWRDAADGGVFADSNPATGAKIADVARRHARGRRRRGRGCTASL